MQCSSGIKEDLKDRVDPRSGHVGFVEDRVALGKVFSKYFSFHCKFSVYQILHTLHHLSSRASKTGQIMADEPSGLNSTPPGGGEKRET